MNMEIIGTALISEIFKKVCSGASDMPAWIKEKLQTSDPFRIEAGRYVKQIAEHYNSMRIIGMSQPVPLDDIYINVNVRNQTGVSIDANLWEWGDPQDLVKYESYSVPAATVIDQHSKVLILGRPGAGKTTFLKHLAITTLNKALKHDLVPVFISLKDWSQERSVKLETALFRQFDICELAKPKEFVRNLLRKGRCLILLDGFDEIETNFRSTAISQIEAIVKDFPNNRFVLSCRTAANTYIFSGFREIEIADFNDSQIKVFIRKWFNSKTISDRCINELQEPDKQGIKILASNPLLLTLICIAYSESFSFPDSRVDLYEIALDALLKKWDTSRDIVRYNPYKRLNVRKKELLLSRLAAFGFDRQIAVYSVKRFSSIIDDFMTEIVGDEEYEGGAQGVLDAIEAQHGIITRVSDDEYTFSHLTFQEYYTAKCMVDNMDSTLICKAISKHIGDPRWNEVFLVYCGLQKDGSHFIYYVKLAIDKLRNAHVEAAIKISGSQIRRDNLFPATMNIALSLYKLLDHAADDSWTNDEPLDAIPTVKQTAQGELVSTSNLANLTAKKLAKAYNLKTLIDSAAIRITDYGLASNMEKFNNAVDDLESNQVGWRSLQKFLFGVHILASCLAGEATIRRKYREAVLEQLFLDGCPEPHESEDDFLFL